MFYLHYTYVDKVFWEWQSADLPARLYEIGGTNVGNVDENDTWAEILSFVDYNGDYGNVTTLSHTLFVFEIQPNVAIGDVMDISDETICAEYI